MSTKGQLDQATFEQLLAIHGSRIERWPEALRQPLARWLESSEAARARWAEAAELDAWLGAVPEIEPASELVALIASHPGGDGDAVAEWSAPEDAEAMDEEGDDWTEVSGLVMGADWAPEDE
jgi:hypothetical protein